MATSDPWRCMYCKKISKATANGCSQCLTAWQDCQDTTYVPPSKQQKYSQQQYSQQASSSNWDWNQYQDGSHTPRTPRGTKLEWQHPKSPRQGRGKGRGKAKKKEQLKGHQQQIPQKGKAQEIGQEKGKGKTPATPAGTMIPPEPPWTPSLNSATGLAPLPPPTEPPPTSEEGIILKELINALKKSPTEQDPEVKAIVQKTTLKEARCSTNTVHCSRRFDQCTGSFGLRQIGKTQPAYTLEEFLGGGSHEVAETHRRFSKRGEGVIRSHRGCQTSTATCGHKVRGIQDRTGRSSCRCGCRRRDERGIRRSRQGHHGGGSSREPNDHVCPTGLTTSICRSNGDRGGELQQKTKNRWRSWIWTFFLCGSWNTSWITTCDCISHATVCREGKAAFWPARQAVTEKYTCQGQPIHPIILKWGHSACQESWFVTEWEALEAAFELSWKLDRTQNTNSTVKLSKPTCGRGRHVQFSPEVDLCFCSPSEPVKVSFTTTHEAIQQWPNKPWSLRYRNNDVSIDEASLEPLSSRAVLIRKHHIEPFHETFRTTDAFHNVPSSWQNNEPNPGGQDDEEDETQFFLHEEPDSVQILFDAFLREGLIIGPSLTD